MSGLGSLTRLDELDLQNNRIEDISALAGNTGLDGGENEEALPDIVDLRNNLLDCDDAATLADLQALVNRSVELCDDCP
jgi:Leucine-rich repeat (LRR) protein